MFKTLHSLDIRKPEGKNRKTNSGCAIRCGENQKNAVIYLFIALNTVSIYIKDIPIFFGTYKCNLGLRKSSTRLW